MRRYEFSVWVLFGRSDGGNSSIEMEVTDEEYELIMQAKEQGVDFCDVPALTTLYDQTYEAAYEQEFESFFEWYEYDPDDDPEACEAEEDGESDEECGDGDDEEDCDEEDWREEEVDEVTLRRAARNAWEGCELGVNF